ncbi:phage tail fiber protein [Agrobacterium tumefaciens]|uniref:phage tail fiber protein n=1 Tax=Agrobacterium tumefaciens TaxID=358 RepID=UPI0021CEDEF6|nr:hypothetical protein [Agrobacterium tumefaciens]UXS01615.1 hypothetical protein FY156_09105 [Agrobacterium tumefaciens]
MAGFSDYLEAAVAAWVNGTAMPTAPANRYVALFNGDPTDPGSGGAEVTTTIRVAGRVVGTFGRTGGVLTLNADADFGAAAAAATVSHFGVYDAASAGNLLMYGPLTGGAQSVGAGTNVKFANGALVLTVD